VKRDPQVEPAVDAPARGMVCIGGVWNYRWTGTGVS